MRMFKSFPSVDITTRSSSAVVAGLMVAAWAPISSAATLADYSFAGGSAASSDTNAATAAMDFSPTNYVVESGQLQGGISGSSESLYVFTLGTPADEATALADDQYHSFTLDTLGETVSLSELNFDNDFFNTNPVITSNVAVFSSITGFTAGNALATSTIVGGAQGNNVSGNTEVVDLTGGTFDNLTGTIEFRFYYYDNSGASDRTYRTDNIQLEGTVVPEPSSLVLAGLGTAMMISRRRRSA